VVTSQALVEIMSLTTGLGSSSTVKEEAIQKYFFLLFYKDDERNDSTRGDNFVSLIGTW
jgi:hypothetical protein